MHTSCNYCDVMSYLLLLLPWLPNNVYTVWLQIFVAKNYVIFVIVLQLQNILLRKFFMWELMNGIFSPIAQGSSLEYASVGCWYEMSLFKYFKRNSLLPSPSGEIPSTAIGAANYEVLKVLEKARDLNGKGVKQRGPYQRYSDTERATIGNCAQMHGPTAALHHFKTQYPELKYTTICDWKKAIADEEKKTQ